MFLPFLSKPLLKSAYRYSKMGFFILIWNLLLWFSHSKIVLSALFPHYFQDFRNLEIGFPAFKMALLHLRNAEINIKVAETEDIAEIAKFCCYIAFSTIIYFLTPCTYFNPFLRPKKENISAVHYYYLLFKSIYIIDIIL